MKRVDEARVIKLADSGGGGGGPLALPPTAASVAAAASAAASAPSSIPMVTSAATIVNTTIFPSRPLTGAEMPQQPLPNQNVSSATSFTRVITHGGGGVSGGGGGVSVYRDSVAITAVPSSNPSQQQPPPAAHGGAGSMQMSSLHPSQVGSPIVTQPPSNIKPEPIALPTTPVSVQYANTASFVSNSIKTTSSASSSSAAGSVHSIVHNLQQQQQAAHHQQIAHQKAALQTVTYGPPGMRTITTASLPTVPNAAATAAAAAAAAANNAAAAAAAATLSQAPPPSIGNNNAQFQRLKVEDALSYLDQVKYKFGNQPQVYNDFLDIMKEFKSQSIDTPGVIARVSCLFKGHPELIVGFNTFLPPGYKIEVQCSNDGGLNLGGLLGGSGGMQTIVHTPHGIHTMGAHGHMSALQILQPAPMQSQQQQQVPLTTASIRPVPIPLPVQQQQPKYTGIKSETLLPQQPTPAHLTAYSGPQLQQPQLPQNTHLHLNNASAAHAAAAAAHAAANSQPVEFNHAINYVNKIKNRFQGQPDVYKQFLEILHTYQKDQKAIKEGQPTSGKFLTEAEVYAKVSKLFQNQEDLLSEFGQFLPEATNDQAQSAIMSGKVRKPSSSSGAGSQVLGVGLGSLKPYGQPPMGIMSAGGIIKFSPQQQPQLPQHQPMPLSGGMMISGGGLLQGKRPPSGIAHPPPKKQKMGVLRDVSLAEAGKWGTLNEFAFFDKVRKALRSPEVYNNFLRCLVLFNQEVISRQELVQLTSTFLHKHPDLFKWFKDFVGFKDGQIITGRLETSATAAAAAAAAAMPLPPPMPGRERMSGDSAMEVDYATCKRLGASYCALPKTFLQPKCSGRTTLCKEVLNDTWVSFPSWSEDSQFVTSRKTQYEEFIYRTEDERFEFDVVLETNKDTIKILECVQKKMSRMPPEEAARYKLDDCLGGSSPTIHQRAIRRIYGDKANDIIDGLKRNPVVAVPLVLRRLKAKDEEWRDVQKNFNKVWRDQNEKYYLKSLDHQGILFKQTDTRNLRSKSLLNEIEALYDERHEQEDHQSSGGGGGGDASASATDGGVTTSGPHMTLEYEDRSILEDANNLLIHHVKRQTGIHKEDKQKIKVLLKQFLLDLFKHPRQELSDDEKEDADEDEKEEQEDSDDKEANNGGGSGSATGSKSTRSERARKKKEESKKEKEKAGGGGSSSSTGSKKEKEITEADVKVPTSKDGRRTPNHARDMMPDESYSHMMCNNNWYIFLRLHHILCERLTKMYNQAVIIASEESSEKKERKESTAIALRLKPKSEIDPEDYYPTFLEMVRNVLDGNMEAQAFEDTLREMFGIHAYNSFTLDKVIGNAVRQLQHLVSDDAAVECYDLFLSEAKNFAAGGACATAADRLIPELIYQKKAEKLLVDENCMKVFIYHNSQKMTIEMLDTESESQNSEHDEETTRKWHSYIERFIQPGEAVSDECKEHLTKKPVFLPRGIRSYRKSPFGKMKQHNQFKGATALPTTGTPAGPPVTSGTGTTNSASATSKGKKRGSGKRDDMEEDEEDRSDNTDGGNESEAKDTDTESKSNRLRHFPNNGVVIHEDNLQCQFNPRTLKILYVINSENCFYRRQALNRAKESHKKVSQRKFGDFNRWHKTWLSDHVTESQHSYISEWFLGHTDGLLPNKTIKVPRDDPDRTPYRLMIKYREEVGSSSTTVKVTASSTGATTATTTSSSTSSSGLTTTLTNTAAS